MSRIPYARQDITDTDVAAVAAALRAPLITQGPGVAAFEVQLAALTGARFAVVFSSGTAALHSAYFAAGIQPGRAVLTSPVTFAATANAACYLGGAVRFADVDRATALLDPGAVAHAAEPSRSGAPSRAGTESIHALVPVHFGGHVAPMPRLAELAAARGWTVVEDAAHALGAFYRDETGRRYRVGACAHSAMCCFSFHPVKHVTTGEGGAVTTNDGTLAKALRRFRTHGITRDAAELEAAEGPWYYEQHDLGFNYRISDFQCALGQAQLARLADSVARRRDIAARYDAGFAGHPGIAPMAAPTWSEGAYHLYVIRVAASGRRAVFDGLRAAGIEVNVHYIPVYRHPYYRARGFARTRLAGAEAHYAGAITLPMYPALRDGQVDRVIAEVMRQVERHEAVHAH